MRLRSILGLASVLGAGAGAALACNAAPFNPQSRVDSVRMFAVKADKPYAKPGDDVTLETLMTDGRGDKAHPLKLYWIPVVCTNPRDDLYYLCFIPDPTNGADGGAKIIPVGPLADGGADGGGGNTGAAGGALANIPTGVDLGPFLPQGTTFTFHIPTDIIQPRLGIDPYGIAYVFNIACAGKVELAVRDPAAGPQQVPILCTDDNGVALLPKDYVIGISRVYAYTTRTNTNPVIDSFKQDDKLLDPVLGVTVDHCDKPKSIDCPDVKLDTHITDESWEPNPNPGQEDAKEQIWVDYYSDIGDWIDDTRLLFDTRKGRVDDTTVKFHAPKTAGEGTIWAVVHDNRGGAAWIVLPLHVK